MEQQCVLYLQLFLFELGDPRGVRCGPAGLFFDETIEPGMSGFKALSMASIHQRLSMVDRESE